MKKNNFLVGGDFLHTLVPYSFHCHSHLCSSSFSMMRGLKDPSLLHISNFLVAFTVQLHWRIISFDVFYLDRYIRLRTSWKNTRSYLPFKVVLVIFFCFFKFYYRFHIFLVINFCFNSIIAITNLTPPCKISALSYTTK